ncbi:hypothetical protein [Sphingobacterium hungaricum]
MFNQSASRHTSNTKTSAVSIHLISKSKTALKSINRNPSIAATPQLKESSFQ